MALLDFFKRRRPYNLSDQQERIWRDRAVAAVSMIRNVTDLPTTFSVVDLGAGDRKLEMVLRASFEVKYQGYDVLPQSPEVKYCDLNAGLPHPLGDVNFALGLLEYLTSLEQFFSAIAATRRPLIFSLVTTDSGKYTADHARKRGWRNLLSQAEINTKLEACGLSVVEQLDMAPHPYCLWLVRAG